MQVREDALKLEKDIIQWRRELHRIPEIDLYLPQTAEYVFNKLAEMGIEAKKLQSCTGVVGIIEGKTQDKTVALRADMDALPIKEETGLAFASQNDNMHACGHDAHMAMLLGAAAILKKHQGELKGNVKLIFQPGEEGSGGAQKMIAEGVLENPQVKAILGLHTGNLVDDIKNGQLGLCFGTAMASQDHFVIRIKGKGCHGASPELGVDPIVIAAQVVTALQTIISREINAAEPSILTIGRITGGSTYNVIPAQVELEGTVRVVNPENRKKIALRIEEMVSSITKAMRGGYEIDYFSGYPELTNDPVTTQLFYQTAVKIMGAENVKEIKKPLMGSEDMSYYLKEVPGAYAFLGSIPEGDCYPHHNSRFDINEKTLWIGSALLAQGALDLLDQ